MTVDDLSLADLLAETPDEEVRELLGMLGASFAVPLSLDDDRADVSGSIPEDVIGQATELDTAFVAREHLVHLAEVLRDGLERVERGEKVYIALSMPPRMGKTTTTSKTLPVLTLRKHPDWPIGLISHDPTLASEWGRDIRRAITDNPKLGVRIAPDAGAVATWQTTERGGVTSRSVGGSIVGRGFKILVIDDPHKGFVDAHSEVSRNRVWNWWLGDAYTRLDRGGHMVIVVCTRWHEDDFIGRLLSTEHEGDPADWIVVNLPAIAEETDALGREPGEPLLSPQVPDETPQQATETWAQIREAVGDYMWNAAYQGSPHPSKGAIFDVGWWRYWTTNPDLVTEDGRVVYLNPLDLQDDPQARWLESLDCAFKGKDDSDYVVIQRWCRKGVGRFLIDQDRARRSFTSTLSLLREWAGQSEEHCHLRIVEDKANGTAVIDTLKKEISGLVPENPTESKEARARAMTPEIEAGNVYLPHPTERTWVTDFINEHRSFPNGKHDDQVDAATQALRRLRKFGQSTTTSTAAYAKRMVG